MNFVTLAWILGSIVSSTSIIIINKYVMDSYHFGCVTFLTAYHFLLTFLVLEIMCRLHLFERASHIPKFEMWYMAAYGVGAVVFMNFNLRFNSVGFYQLSKLSVIPVIVVYNFIFEGKNTAPQTLISLGILLVGLALFTVNDVQLNLFGSVIALIGVTCVAVFQTKTGSKQREYNVNGPALQHATAFPQFVMALLSACAIETHGTNSIFTHDFQTKEIIMITITGFIAVSVNVCSFGLIGKTSAVTYQVVGHVKTILIFVFGLIMFPPNKNETKEQFYKKIAGLVISMTGMIYYTYLELQQKEASTKPSPTVAPFLKDGAPNSLPDEDEEAQLSSNLQDVKMESLNEK
ncbi:integral membrane protein [Tritrichomonas foetus]|uniref:Integral membrane protein n=1 Tax=Tritrichomonas foetus TaxID=1144522 RepID=A0A1J4KDF1_9EUKA|nr:integral membrane protein [Tritrichomonas foetus]|eukprot:OHT07654.1 integral membrane protein [Tritrichomonas foetus]